MIQSKNQLFIVSLIWLSLCGLSKSITVSNPNQGRVHLQVEPACTLQEKNYGLQYRKALGNDAGMLFVYDTPMYVSFWMKNTLIPLDILFVNDEGEVVQIETRMDTRSYRKTSSNEPIQYVLEINAHQAKKLGIKPYYSKISLEDLHSVCP